ncbi:hypothetical protein [Metabacillus indicus]|uniref:hypothetical protein n=1 Tax=Metabacillus indicus TaxID=246786 RepID=UPI0004935923|nr:hypothetical protein [Metabacillus indicus]KEZ48797.1 hypothetical protein AZ46_0218105 [Metabacillus indicus LMG 22858]
MINSKIMISIFLSVFMISGCSKEGGMEKKEIEKMASNVAIEFMLIKEDIDLVVTDVQITNDDVGVAFVNGYEKKDKTKEYSVMVDYLNDFEVDGVGSSQ